MDTVEVVGGVLTPTENDADMSDGTTVVGGVKKVPSSTFSKKSLGRASVDNICINKT